MKKFMKKILTDFWKSNGQIAFTRYLISIGIIVTGLLLVLNSLLSPLYQLTRLPQINDKTFFGDDFRGLPQEKYLFVKDVMFYGLNNQLMTFLAYGEIAAELNRTLILPKFSAQFPKQEEVMVDFEDIFQIYRNPDENCRFNLPYPGFPSALIDSDKMLPTHSELGLSTVILTKSDKSGFINSAASYDDTILAVQSFQPGVYQPMSQKLLTRYYNSFQPNARLREILFETMVNFIPTTELEQNYWSSIMVIHLRIEEDWLKYSNKEKFKHKREILYVDFPTIQQRITRFLNKLHHNALPKTIILSYAVNKLPPGIVDLKKGWPAPYKIVTNDEIFEEMTKNIDKELSYLEQSFLLSYISYKSKIFFGNWHSSFSQTILSARALTQERESYIYNTEEIENFKNEDLYLDLM